MSDISPTSDVLPPVAEPATPTPVQLVADPDGVVAAIALLAEVCPRGGRFGISKIPTRFVAEIFDRNTGTTFRREVATSFLEAAREVSGDWLRVSDGLAEIRRVICR